ncbi:hypothetical protein ACKVWC_007377 [Pyricularia oryzae]
MRFHSFLPFLLTGALATSAGAVNQAAADSGNPTTKALAGSSTDNVHGIPQHAHVNTVERRGDYIDDDDKEPPYYRGRGADDYDDDDERGGHLGKGRGRPPIRTKSRHVRRSDYDSDDDRPGSWNDWDTKYKRTKGGSSRSAATSNGKAAARP